MIENYFYFGPFWQIVLLVLLPCSLTAGVVAWHRNGVPLGMLLGFLCGPFGIIMATAIDFRHRCPDCGKRLEDNCKACGSCRAPIKWQNGQPFVRFD
jgi:hypothetical protein